ncbi:unnamed protein product [Miscanthus lutarioriparius]|uniref:Ribosome assembly factor mrt4 n=1 Tax=Miscanthus lutarioriparius TaxID=422564 RepID=A0A811QMG4_9POAL|nr:unnamed protein product [Miscanthus lutarioriparius]
MLSTYSSAYVFTYDNMRNQKLKDLREQLKSSSRIFLAGKKVMQIVLGRSPADEAKTGLHKLSKFLQGDSGLFFTNLPRDDVERMFREFEEHDFARTGSTATETVELKEGPLEQFTHEMEPFLRKQGLPVRLNKGVVELVADHVVCEEGKPLSPEAAQTLGGLEIRKMLSAEILLVYFFILSDLYSTVERSQWQMPNLCLVSGERITD